MARYLGFEHPKKITKKPLQAVFWFDEQMFRAMKYYCVGCGGALGVFAEKPD